MPGQYNIDTKQNLLVVMHTGQMSVDDLIAFNKSIVADPDFKKMNVFSDLTETEFKFSLGDIDKYREFVRSIRELVMGTKWAIVSSGGITENTARIFSTLQSVYDKIVDVKVFNDKDSAMKWLKE